MSKFNILLQLTGSISCYKACYLASKLIKANCDVQFVASDAALKFIGKATLEGLTHRPVITGMFEDSKMLAHIDLAKWADVILLYPATANTINGLAAGLAGELIGGIFLANNFKVPYWIAPAMNTNMYEHPITQASIKKLEDMGAFIFPTENGILACGDTGPGRLADPSLVYDKLVREYNVTPAYEAIS
ncbi:MAG: phosphopantothenoylcysteine decarboxylase [Bacteriovoracaceae bacterium]|nr:phosphopantothenoylcysteine decarboxylase [Bacteriovoracaceae bacterium]